MTTDQNLAELLTHHVEEVPNFVAFAEIPDVDVAVMAGRQHDAPVEGVGLQDEDLVIVTLQPIKAQAQ